MVNVKLFLLYPLLNGLHYKIQLYIFALSKYKNIFNNFHPYLKPYNNPLYEFNNVDKANYLQVFQIFNKIKLYESNN